MTTGERLKKLRREKDLTQAELAKACGTYQSTIARIERDGTTSNLKAETLKRMANALDSSVDYLLGRQRVGFEPQGYDIRLRSSRPFRVNDLWRKIEPRLREVRPRGDVCIFVEQWVEDGDYVTAIEIKQFRGTGLAKSRRKQRAEEIVAEALKSPLDGCVQLERQLRSAGVRVSASTIQNVLREKELATRRDRVRRLRQRAEASEIELSEKQKSAIRNITFRHGEPPSRSDETRS